MGCGMFRPQTPAAYGTSLWKTSLPRYQIRTRLFSQERRAYVDEADSGQRYEADSIMTPTRPTVPTPTSGRISKYTSYTSKNLSGPPSKPVDSHYFVGTLYKADPYQLVR